MVHEQTIGDIEQELANLANRRITLEARKAKAEAALVAAKSARKSALAADPRLDLSKLTQAVRDGEDEIETLDGVLVDLAEQVADAENRLQAVRAADLRQKATQTLHNSATAVDESAVGLENALAAVGLAFSKLISAIPTDIDIARIGDRTTDSAGLARAILAEGLAKVCPGAFVSRYDNSFIHNELARASRLGDKIPASRFGDRLEVQAGHDTATAARLLVSDRLRARAAEVMDGKASANLADRVLPLSVPRTVPQLQTVDLLAVEDFTFRTAENSPKIVGHRAEKQTLSIALAERLIASGVAVPVDGEEAAALLAEEAKQRRATVISIADAAGGSAVTKAPRSPGSIQYRDLGIIGSAVPVQRPAFVGRGAA